MLAIRFVVIATVFSTVTYIALASLDQATGSAEEQLLHAETQKLTRAAERAYELGGTTPTRMTVTVPEGGVIRVKCQEHLDNVLTATYKGRTKTYTTNARIHAARHTDGSLAPVGGDVNIGPGEHQVYVQASTVDGTRVVLIAGGR